MTGVGIRGNALFVAGVALVLALVGMGYATFLDYEEAPSITAAAPQAAVEQPAVASSRAAQIQRADGSVEIRVGQDWRPAGVGMEVAPGSGVRTGPNGSATVSYGDGIAAEVNSDSVLRVDRLDDRVARFVVGQGSVVLDVSDAKPGRVVQLAADGSDAVLETTAGRVAVLNDGKGQLQAAVTRGNAQLSANGGQIDLAEGQQSIIAPGKPPSAPAPIPRSLLLKVQWPKKQTTKRHHRVVGTTNPGARVRVGGRLITADAKGRFSAVVDLREGANRISIEAVDVVGRTQGVESPEIVVDSKAPDQTIETDPGMWRKSPSKDR